MRGKEHKRLKHEGKRLKEERKKIAKYFEVVLQDRKQMEGEVKTCKPLNAKNKHRFWNFI